MLFSKEFARKLHFVRFEEGVVAKSQRIAMGKMQFLYDPLWTAGIGAHHICCGGESRARTKLLKRRAGSRSRATAELGRSGELDSGIRAGCGRAAQGRFCHVRRTKRPSQADNRPTIGGRGEYFLLKSLHLAKKFRTFAAEMSEGLFMKVPRSFFNRIFIFGE